MVLPDCHFYGPVSGYTWVDGQTGTGDALRPNEDVAEGQYFYALRSVDKFEGFVHTSGTGCREEDDAFTLTASPKYRDGRWVQETADGGYRSAGQRTMPCYGYIASTASMNADGKMEVNMENQGHLGRLDNPHFVSALYGQLHYQAEPMLTRSV